MLSADKIGEWRPLVLLRSQSAVRRQERLVPIFTETPGSERYPLNMTA